MPGNLIFHESFDSTRTAGNDTAPNLAQAQAEALVSLLLGHSLTLPNTYAFDSRGVLDLVTAVMAARNDVLGHLPGGSAAHERINTANPFLVTWHNAPRFLDACVSQLRNYAPEKIEKRFVLSAWKAIDYDPRRRFELADALLADPHPLPPAWLSEFENFPEQFEAVRILNDYARRSDRGSPTSQERGTDLIAYLEYYRELGIHARRIPELAKKAECPVDIAMDLWKRIDQEFRQDGVEDKLRSRSWVHAAAEQDNEPAEARLLERLKELIDTFYNARLAESAYAGHDFLSSVPRSDDAGLKFVNDLAVNVICDRRQVTIRPPLQGIFTAPENEPVLEVAPMRHLFQAYWSMLADDQRYRSWLGTSKRVNTLLGQKPPDSGKRGAAATRTYLTWAGQFEEAWADHMTLLRRELGDVVRTDDGSLVVKVSNFEHVHKIELPTRNEVDTALATGCYVSNMQTWVSI